MDIKLRARLSAYSKIDSLEELQTTIPVPGEGDVHSVLGVGSNGKYTLFPKATTDDYDATFGTTESIDHNRTATHAEIDELFKSEEKPKSVDKSAIDQLFELTEDEPQSVDKTTIDMLFVNQEDPDAVDKSQIDTLFTSTDSKPTIGTVSYAAIDSLFD